MIHTLEWIIYDKYHGNHPILDIHKCQFLMTLPGLTVMISHSEPLENHVEEIMLPVLHPLGMQQATWAGTPTIYSSRISPLRPKSFDVENAMLNYQRVTQTLWGTSASTTMLRQPSTVKYASVSMLLKPCFRNYVWATMFWQLRRENYAVGNQGDYRQPGKQLKLYTWKMTVTSRSQPLLLHVGLWDGKVKKWRGIVIRTLERTKLLSEDYYSM